MPTERARNHGAIAFAAGFCLLGIWALYETREISELGAVFPKTVAGAMIVFSIAYIGYELLRPSLERALTQPESTPRRILLVVVMLGWVALMPVVGFIASSAVAFALIIIVANYDTWGRSRILAYSITAVGVVGGFYALFVYALKVPLPEGALF